MTKLVSNKTSLIESAAYDPKTGMLDLAFKWDALLQSQGEFGSLRHVDALTINSGLGSKKSVYEIEIHADDGPRDQQGRYIYSQETMENEFSINIGKGINFSDKTLSFGLTDHADGQIELNSFKLVPEKEVVISKPPVSVPTMPDSEFRVFLADASDNIIMREIHSGDNLGSWLSKNPDTTLVVTSEGNNVGSIKIGLDNFASRTESVEPFALFGDVNGDLLGGTALSAGKHTINLTAYSQDGGAGNILAQETFTFTIDQFTV